MPQISTVELKENDTCVSQAVALVEIFNAFFGGWVGYWKPFDKNIMKYCGQKWATHPVTCLIYHHADLSGISLSAHLSSQASAKLYP